MDSSQLAPDAAPPESPHRRKRLGLGGRNFSGFGLVATLVSLTIVFFTLYPVGTAVVRALYSGGQWRLFEVTSVFQQRWFLTTIKDTAIVATSTTVLSVSIALVFSWCNERTDASLGVFGRFIPLVPLLSPPVITAVGWVVLGVPEVGYLNSAARALGGGDWVNVESMPGLIWVQTLRLVPFAYLVISSTMANLDPSLEEASIAHGAGLFRTAFRVSIPAIRPAIFGALLLATIQAYAEFSIPRVIAPPAHIDILSVRVVQMLTVRFPPQTAQALGLAGMLFAVIFIVWSVQRKVSASGSFAKIGGRGMSRRAIRLGPWRWVARGAMIAYVFLASILPVGATILLSFQPFWSGKIEPAKLTLAHYSRMFGQSNNGSAVLNSVKYGTLTATIGMAAATILMLFIVRLGNRRGKWIDVISKIPAAFSGVVLGVGFLLAFAGAPFNLHGTAAILILCYLIIFLPEASIIAGNAASEVGQELREASLTSGASEGRTMMRVSVPLMIPTLIAGWALIFVMSAGEITASVLLSAVNTPVIGRILIDMWDSGSYGMLTALTTVLAGVCSLAVIMAVTLSWLIQARRR